MDEYGDRVAIQCIFVTNAITGSARLANPSIVAGSVTWHCAVAVILRLLGVFDVVDRTVGSASRTLIGSILS